MVAIQLVVVLSLDRIGWYEPLLLEFSELGWVGILCYLLRLRDFRRYSARPRVRGANHDNHHADNHNNDFELQSGKSFTCFVSCSECQGTGNLI